MHASLTCVHLQMPTSLAEEMKICKGKCNVNDELLSHLD